MAPPTPTGSAQVLAVPPRLPALLACPGCTAPPSLQYAAGLRARQRREGPSYLRLLQPHAPADNNFAQFLRNIISSTLPAILLSVWQAIVLPLWFYNCAQASSSAHGLPLHVLDAAVELSVLLKSIAFHQPVCKLGALIRRHPLPDVPLRAGRVHPLQLLSA